MTIVYRLGNKLYLNITNECSCNCVFCIRNHIQGVGDATNLWLEREPTLKEIKAALDETFSSGFEAEEIVFCGYGEPMMRADDVILISQYIKKMYLYLPMSEMHTKSDTLLKSVPKSKHSSLYGKPAPSVRVNTNGLAFLMCPGFEVERLAVVDTVSISLNADDSEEYLRLARPRYGEGAFESLLDFARAAKAYTNVIFSVVDGTLSAQRLENCRRIAEEIGVELRVRGME